MAFLPRMTRTDMCTLLFMAQEKGDPAHSDRLTCRFTILKPFLYRKPLVYIDFDTIDL